MNHHRETNFVSKIFPFTIDDCLVAAIRLVQFFSYEFFTRVSCLPPFNEKRRRYVQKLSNYLFRRIWRVNTNKLLYNDHSHRLTDWLTDIVRCQHLFPLPYPVSLPFSFEFVRKKEGKKWDINRKKMTSQIHEEERTSTDGWKLFQWIPFLWVRVCVDGILDDMINVKPIKIKSRHIFDIWIKGAGTRGW